MNKFTEHAPGNPCWVDLMSPDVDKAKSFYSTVFGWQTDDAFDDEGNRIYVNCSLEGAAVAGIGGLPDEHMPSAWSTYISVASVEDTLAKVEDAGGTVLMPAMEVMEFGHMGILADPAGAALSLWKAKSHIGAEIAGVAGSVCWNELNSRDLEASKAFYSAVLGWEYDFMDMSEATGDADDPGYTVVKGGEGGLAGLMTMPDHVPAEVPSHWVVYFLVDDVQKTAEIVQQAGGGALNDPMYIPTVGHLGFMHDDQGAMFAIMTPEIPEP